MHRRQCINHEKSGLKCWNIIVEIIIYLVQLCSILPSYNHQCLKKMNYHRSCGFHNLGPSCLDGPVELSGFSESIVYYNN